MNNKYIYKEECLHGCAKLIGYTEEDNGCWICISHPLHPNSKYISINRNGGTISLHRHIWMLANNQKLTRGDVIKQTCGNIKCIRPNHLVKIHKISFTKRKLTEDQADQIRIQWTKGIDQRTIAKEFSVSQSTVSNIIANRIYRKFNVINPQTPLS